MREKKNIGIFVTQYSLMLYMLMEKQWKKTFFLWDATRIDPNIKANMKICGARYMLGTLCDNIGFKNNNTLIIRIARRLLSRLLFISLSLFGKLVFSPNKYNVYGHDHASLAVLFYNYRFILIEDGTANYLTKEEVVAWFSKYCPNILKRLIPVGFSDKVDEVYLTGRKEIKDDFIRLKAKIFDLKKCWNEKSDLEKREILFIFGYDLKKINEIVSSGRDVWVITQNFSAFYCSEEEQILMYRSLINDVDEQRVVIKPHPADKICYEKYFPNCMVLRCNFPFELVYLTDVPVKKIIALCSTSIYGLWPDAIIESHEDIYRNLLKSANKVNAYDK